MVHQMCNAPIAESANQSHICDKDHAEMASFYAGIIIHLLPVEGLAESPACINASGRPQACDRQVIGRVPSPLELCIRCQCSLHAFKKDLQEAVPLLGKAACAAIVGRE